MEIVDGQLPFNLMEIWKKDGKSRWTEPLYVKSDFTIQLFIISSKPNYSNDPEWNKILKFAFQISLVFSDFFSKCSKNEL